MRDNTAKYVDILIRHNVDGTFDLKSIFWEDGREFVIESWKRIPAPPGVRSEKYEIVIKGQNKFLWHDEDGWYVWI